MQKEEVEKRNKRNKEKLKEPSKKRFGRMDKCRSAPFEKEEVKEV